MMMKMKIRDRKINEATILRVLAFMMLIVMTICVLLPTTVWAAEKEDRKVRVGWYHSDLFQEGMSDEEEKYGYSYKYLQVISSYSGWEYEYVYGEWPELLEMLRNGEIDVMAGVSDTPEREAYLSFPLYEMGNETYCLYQPSC